MILQVLFILAKDYEELLSKSKAIEMQMDIGYTYWIQHLWD